MELHLEGRVAMVTGAASPTGYGRAIAIALAEEGCNLALIDMDLDGARKTAEDIRALGQKALPLRANVAIRKEVNEAVKQALNGFEKIDILVNNAGARSKMKPFLDTKKYDWDFDIAVNLYGQMNCAQAVLPHMVARHYGRIINTSGGQGLAGPIAYGAANASVVQWSRSLAREVAPLGVIVTFYSPGVAATRLTTNDPRLDALARASPLGRLCRPEDMAPVVAFLASDISTFYALSLSGAAGG